MSDDLHADLPPHTSGLPSYPAAPVVPAGPPPVERVGLGLLGALGAVVAGIVLTVVIWRAGYIASVTGFAMAAGAVWLYVLLAGARPRKGLIPLVLLVILGVVVSFFAVVASDLGDVYNTLIAQTSELDRAMAPSKTDFIKDNLFRGEVLSSYGKDIAMFGGFAALGIFGTLRRLFASD